MSNTSKRLMGSAAALALALGSLASIPNLAGAAEGQNTKALEKGKALAFDRKKGNCLACHHIDGGTAAGTIGPPLIAMSVRFPDKEKLRAQIWDATIANPESPMPPFGSHHILSDTEVDLIVDFVWSL